MTFATLRRAFCAFALSLFAVHASAAPILVINSSGLLTGALNVDVKGVLYDVTFADGTCKTLFNCQTSAFPFKLGIEAEPAARALLDQVFVNSSLGQFDSSPNKVFGCTGNGSCTTWIPYIATYNLMYLASAVNGKTEGADKTATFTTTDPNYESGGNENFAIFKLAAAVPEPGSIILSALALAVLLLLRRRAAAPRV